MTLFVKDLSLYIDNENILKDITFSLGEGECLAIIGQSGSGKSTLGKALARLNPENATLQGEILYNGRNILTLNKKELENHRGKEVAIIFQDSLTSLNPTMRVGNQVIESFLKHNSLMTKQTAHQKALQLFNWVGIANPEEKFNCYPHEFSGGMRQRVGIAIALACAPKILIADEPTSALDATIGIQIIDLLKKIQKELGMSILFITHDLNIITGFATRILNMQNGSLSENIPKEREFLSKEKTISCTPLIKVSSLTHYYNKTPILQDVSFEIDEGETFGIVGESGSGKTTLALLLMNLQKPTAGKITYKERPYTNKSPKEIQMIFQDPYSSLDPHMLVKDILKEPLIIYKIGTRESQKKRVLELIELVGLDQSFLNRYPHELSGGQRQRVGIARALAPNPKFLICDEPTSALDLRATDQIIDLLKNLQKKLHLTYLFISHDLRLIRHLTDRVAVMQNGRILELEQTETLYSNPQHDYTKKLLSTLTI